MGPSLFGQKKKKAEKLKESEQSDVWMWWARG